MHNGTLAFQGICFCKVPIYLEWVEVANIQDINVLLALWQGFEPIPCNSQSGDLCTKSLKVVTLRKFTTTANYREIIYGWKDFHLKKHE